MDCVYSYTLRKRKLNVKSVGSRDIMRLLKGKGSREIAVRGSHYQFKHATIPGRVTVPHPRKDLPWPTVKSILKQAELSEEDLT